MAIITGASRGIGLGIAQRLVCQGARVAITARNKDDLETAVATLGGGENALGIAGRADDPDHQADVVNRAMNKFGPIDFLVNNAGINPVLRPLVEIDLDAVRKVVEVNCIAALAWVQTVHRACMAEHGGAVVNVSSVASLAHDSAMGLYGASKAMLNFLTAHLAVELAPNVRVNGVAPAVVKTAFASPLYEGREAEVAGTYPLRRLGEPSDIGRLVAFLLSEDASWLTGQIVTIDGGVSLLGYESKTLVSAPPAAATSKS